MTWAETITQWTLGGLYGNGNRMDKAAAGLWLNAASDKSLRDLRAQQCINRMTTFYKLKLEDILQKTYPSDMQSMQTFIERRKEQLKEFQAYKQDVADADQAIQPTPATVSGFLAYPEGGALWLPNNSVYGVINQRPRFFTVEGPVDNNLLAGVAENGEFAGVVSMANNADMPAQRLYINRGTSASPNWVAWNPLGLTDFVLDATPLLECGYQRVKYYIRDFAIDSDAGESDSRLKNMPPAAKIAKDQATEEEAVAFSLIRIDISDCGVASDFVSGGQTIRKFCF